jgi:3-oxoacyl-[acyl-carrier-protein] synthase II
MAGGASRRVAVTGLGMVTAFGAGVKVFWDALLEGRTALRRLDTVPGPLADLYVGRVEDEALGAAADRTGPQPVERTCALLDVAAAEALEHSGLLGGRAGHRYGLGIGTCQGVLRAPGAELPLDMTRHAVDQVTRPADLVARRYGFTGPRTVISTACSSSTTTLGWAAAQIQDGRADVMLAGGVEALCLFALAGFHGLKATSAGRCAPYTVSDGMSLGEGSAVLVLEEWEHARRRGAPILAQFLGCGMSADAYHAVAPDPTARGALAAMRRALRSAGVGADRVDYVNGHGTGTANNDAMEKEAMILLFGDRVAAVPVSTIKPATGHLLGAAGAMEAVTTVLAIQYGVAPPTVGASGPDPRLDIVPGRPRPTRISVALSNSYAFGGNNASVVLAAGGYQPPSPADGPPVPAAVVLTGIGAAGIGAAGIGTAGIGAAGWLGPLGASTDADAAGGSPEALTPPPGVPPATWRRMDGYTRRALLAAATALADAGIDPRDPAGDADTAALMFATGHGPLDSTEQFGRSLSEDLIPARRAQFAQTTMASAPGTLGICLGLRGPCATFLTEGAAGLQALDYAAGLVARGEAGYAVVVGTDDATATLREAYDRWWRGPDAEPPGAGPPGAGPAPGDHLADGAVALVIEPADRARARGRGAYAVLGGAAQGGGAPFTDSGPTATGAAGIAAVMRQALERAACRPEQVRCVAAAAAGGDALDRAERHALGQVLPPGTPVVVAAAHLGDLLGAASLASVVAGALALRGEGPAPTASVAASAAGTPGAGRPIAGRAAAGADRVLVNAAGTGGILASIVLRLPEPGAGR